MNSSEFFEQELKLLREYHNGEKLIIDDYIKPITDIINIFRSQGQSGGSGPFYAYEISKTIKNILNYEILSPVTGKNDEWENVGNNISK